MRLHAILFPLLLATASFTPGQSIITSAAGTGFTGFSGDGGPANAALLYNPQSAAVDSSGNIYFSDSVNRRIRKITPDGVINTIAGNGVEGAAGDGGPALSANLGIVYQVAVDPAGQHLCFGDYYAYKIRCVTLNTGIIQGYGTGNAMSSGDGGPVANASFYFPMGAAFDDAGNYYMSDFAANNVRRVDAVTGIVTTIAGGGNSGLGDGGPATSANLSFPRGLYYSSGALYIADEGNDRVRRVDLSTSIITTVAGNGSPYTAGDGGPATSAGMTPVWVTLDTSGNLFIVDTQEVRMVDTSGIITRIAGSGNSGWGQDDIAATDTVFGGLNGVTWDAVAKRLLMADGGNNRIRQIFFTPPTTTSLSVSPNPAFPGQQVTLQAAVSPADASGSVRFYSGVLIGSAPVSNGVATLTWTPSGSNSYSLRAVYSGDPTHNLSQSATVTLPVQMASTTTAVSSNLNPSVQGQAVTFTATVMPSTATGSVTFRNGGSPIGTAAVASGVATFTTAALPAGGNSITASYGGSSSYYGSTSAAVTQTVKFTSTTALASTPNPSALGSIVTLTAAVTPSTTTGSIQFFNGSTLLGSATLSGGQAQLAVSGLPAGTNSLTAVYGGDANDGGGTSAALLQVVKVTTATSLNSSPNPSTFGSAVTLTATVTPSTATGSVQFFNGGTLLGSANLTNGQAQLTVTSLPAGTDSLTAAYGGDAGDASSVSSTKLQTVNKVNSITTLSANPASQSSAGQVVTFTATVAPPAATGVVQFLDGSTLLGSATLNNGTAAFSTSSLAMGNHSIKASYGGDSSVNGSQSAALSYKVKH